MTTTTEVTPMEQALLEANQELERCREAGRDDLADELVAEVAAIGRFAAREPFPAMCEHGHYIICQACAAEVPA
jgi:hypothetical protein